MDPESQAIIAIVDILSPLDQPAVGRILKYLSTRFVSSPIDASDTAIQSVSIGNNETSHFSEFYELFDKANPTTGVEKVLVSAYWFQKILGEVELDGALINQELKNLGYPSTNIARDLEALSKRSPRLVAFRRTEGGRRRYKLTVEGERAVERMLNKSDPDEVTALGKN